MDARTDEELLAAVGAEPAAFGVFYRRHVEDVVAYLHRRTGSAEAAADLTAETFAAALVGRERLDPARGSARQWLFGIAGRELADFHRRGAADRRARRRVGMERLVLDDDDLERIESVAAAAGVGELLDDLPAEQAAAVRGRVVDELAYAEPAARLDTTEAAARQRVSRGLAALRARLTERREA